jgi:hypothetical protein
LDVNKLELEFSENKQSLFCKMKIVIERKVIRLTASLNRF